MYLENGLHFSCQHNFLFFCYKTPARIPGLYSYAVSKQLDRPIVNSSNKVKLKLQLHLFKLLTL